VREERGGSPLAYVFPTSSARADFNGKRKSQSADEWRGSRPRPKMLGGFGEEWSGLAAAVAGGRGRAGKAKEINERCV
jgi:hypothetical protein